MRTFARRFTVSVFVLSCTVLACAQESVPICGFHVLDSNGVLVGQASNVNRDSCDVAMELEGRSFKASVYPDYILKQEFAFGFESNDCTGTSYADSILTPPERLFLDPVLFCKTYVVELPRFCPAGSQYVYGLGPRRTATLRSLYVPPDRCITITPLTREYYEIVFLTDLATSFAPPFHIEAVRCGALGDDEDADK